MPNNAKPVLSKPRPRLALLGVPNCPLVAQIAGSDAFESRAWCLQARAEPVLGAIERLYRALDRRLFGVHSPQSPLAAMQAFDAADVAAWAPDVLVCLTDTRSLPAALRAALPEQRLLVLQAEDQAGDRLSEAVRAQVGRAGGLVRLRWSIWSARAGKGSDTRHDTHHGISHEISDSACLELGQGSDVFEAACAIEHASLQRSIDMVVMKAPAALLGAVRRLLNQAPQPWPGDASAGPPTSPWRLCWHMLTAACIWPLRRARWRIRLYDVHPRSHGLHADSDDVESVVANAAAVAANTPPTHAPRSETRLHSPAGTFWADPFLHRHSDGRLFVFFEEFSFSSARGHIAALELGGNSTGVATTVLREPWHLSYPFLIPLAGKLYMIPESGEHRSVDLYVCDEMPQRWRKVCTLIENKRLADATLVFRNKRWWMFAAHGDDRASVSDEMHIYWAEDLFGPWHAHALNPVRMHGRNTRPAGAFVERNGRLYRPVQDCSDIYGGGLQFTEVLRLDEHHFDEVEVAPDWINLPAVKPGVPAHTFNQLGATVCMDVQHMALRRPSWR